MRFTPVAMLCASVLVFAAGCSNNGQQASQQQQTKAEAPAMKIDPATAATLRGVVKFAGSPKATAIDMSMDPACGAKAQQSESVVVDNGKLANTLVYVKAGLGNYTFETPKAEAIIDQSGCRYHPHVLAVMVNQPVTILNSDNAMHNVHPTPKQNGNKEWNRSQGPKAEPLRTSFSASEIMLPLKCNQHPWMRMYISVLPHPFFAVTDKDGKFEIAGLPPGTYTLAAVHERLGEQEQQITVAPKKDAIAEFSFSESGS
ncbi:MAG TPA: carboxypeptidase regulatory-like domain-containing protein [Clostridia bacterium]|nr:carboxypeptidase regulatory-like domain-containing protein [Clostridia bacterium]